MQYHLKNPFLSGLYRAGTKYTVNVFGMFEGGESMPLAGEEKTTLTEEPDVDFFPKPGKVNLYSYWTN